MYLIDQVWTGYCISVVATILILFFFNRYIFYKYKKTIADLSAPAAPQTDVVQDEPMKSIFPYVIGLLLHQGKHSYSGYNFYYHLKLWIF